MPDVYPEGTVIVLPEPLSVKTPKMSPIPDVAGFEVLPKLLGNVVKDDPLYCSVGVDTVGPIIHIALLASYPALFEAVLDKVNPVRLKLPEPDQTTSEPIS